MISGRFSKPDLEEVLHVHNGSLSYSFRSTRITTVYNEEEEDQI